MFGWLNKTIYHERQRIGGAIGGPSIRTTPRRVAHWLPLLGPLLYVSAKSLRNPAPALLSGLLTESPILAPLLQTEQLRLHGAISADGPREWLDCNDRQGRLLAQLHLLPDTDYLAWDCMPGAVDVAAGGRDSGYLRGGDAHLLSFNCRALGAIDLLAEATPPCLSPLGRVVARSIARSQRLLMHGERLDS